MPVFVRVLWLSLLGFVLSACSPSKPMQIDNPSSEHLHIGAQSNEEAPIPSIKQHSPYLPKPKLTGAESLYSLSVIQAPIRDVLFKLARDAHLELNIVDNISGQVTINLMDQPLATIIERLNDQANIRASLQGRMLTVQADTPYWHNYPVDYVNLDRYSSSSILLANAVGTGAKASPSVTLGTPSTQVQPAASLQAGSNIAILNRAKNELWKTLSDGIARILRAHYPELGAPIPEGQTAQKSTSKSSSKAAGNTASAPQMSTSPAPESAENANKEDSSTAKDGVDTQSVSVSEDKEGKEDKAEALTQDKLPKTARLPMPEQALSTQTEPTAPVGPYPEGESVSTYISVAREAGFVAVYTTRKVHAEIQRYIDDLTNGARRQVMIEATVVEVTLNDENQAGINWNFLSGNGDWSLQQTYSSSTQTPNTAGVSSLTYSSINKDWSLAGTLKMLQRFGNSKVLSSPKIVGVNNQPTLLKVVKNLVYFTLTVTPGTTSSGGITTQATYTSTPNTVPVGLVMSVLPSIDQHNQITLVVRPTISNLVRYVEDPNPEFKKGNLTTPIVSLVPEIQEREMESVLKLNDGQVAVLGGLIQESVAGEDTGLPGAVTDDTVGYLFGQKNKQKSKSELVIFLRPTLIKHPDIETGDFAPQRDYLKQHTSPQATWQP